MGQSVRTYCSIKWPAGASKEPEDSSPPMETTIEPGDMVDYFEPGLLKSPPEPASAKNPHRSDESAFISPYRDGQVEPGRHQPRDIYVDLRSVVSHRLGRTRTGSEPPRGAHNRSRGDRQLAASSPQARGGNTDRERRGP